MYWYQSWCIINGAGVIPGYGDVGDFQEDEGKDEKDHIWTTDPGLGYFPISNG